MKNSSAPYYILAVFFLLLAGLGIYKFRNLPKTATSPGDARPSAAATPQDLRPFLKSGRLPVFAAGAMEPGEVKLELSPEKVEDGVLEVKYFASVGDMVLDAFDLASMSTLQLGDLQVRAVRADPMKGHHDNGLIYFQLPAGSAIAATSSFTITVTGLPEQATRVFGWR